MTDPKPVPVSELIRHAGEATLLRMVQEASAYEHLRAFLLGEPYPVTQRDYALQPAARPEDYPAEVRPVVERTRIPVGDSADLIVSTVGDASGRVTVEIKVEGEGVTSLEIDLPPQGVPVTIEGREGGDPSGSKAEGGEGSNEVGEAHRPETDDRRLECPVCHTEVEVPKHEDRIMARTLPPHLDPSSELTIPAQCGGSWTYGIEVEPDSDDEG